ncbi:NAD(P)H-dependent flavin oxidoreductase [Oscillatoria salina]|uniref:NAD(P)H-dependent flavin oxidoreductase n=1 Tax=Oscillatoria salina TaxID=331517 RepID=UPI001CCFB629|nr:nitronate monooxygenase family protein [Oscillatoria salina]MBZ8178576.1 nitronate monooxygenase [Oscillatoria salina IIICB1]
MKTLTTLRIGKYTPKYPIIQGGMGIRISGANLASAVANAGGIGVISAVGLGLKSPYFDRQEKNVKQRQEKFFAANRLALIDELKKARLLSPNGIIGVNIMVAARDYETLVRTAAENGANLIISGAGLPMNLPEYTANYPDVALVPIISSDRAAKLICRRWERHHQRLPDAFIVENPQTAGGHLGVKKEELANPAFSDAQIIPQLVKYLRDELGVNIPIIAAGGVWDRTDIDRVLALGASGVQIGTRFITTHECDADIRYKEFHLHATPEDVVIVPSPVGMPGRALKNAFAEKAIANSPDLEKRCLANCLHTCRCRDSQETYCIIQALDNAVRGNVDNGLIFAGSNAGRSQKMMSVAELMAELTDNN